MEPSPLSTNTRNATKLDLRVNKTLRTDPPRSSRHVKQREHVRLTLIDVLDGYGALPVLPSAVLGSRQVDVRGVGEAKGQLPYRVEEAEDDVVDDIAAVRDCGWREMDDEGAETADWVCGGRPCGESGVGSHGWVVREAGCARRWITGLYFLRYSGALKLVLGSYCPFGNACGRLMGDVENLRGNAVEPTGCMESQDIHIVRITYKTQTPLRTPDAIDTLVHDLVRHKCDIEETEHHGIRAMTLDRNLAAVVPPSSSGITPGIGLV